MVFRAGAGRWKDAARRHKWSWSHMLQEKLRARRVSELSAQSPGRTHSGTLASCVIPYVPLIFSPLPLSTVTYSWFTGRHPHCPQTRGWTLDRSQARGESWSLPSAVYRGEFFSVLSFYLRFLHFFECGSWPFQCDQGWHLPFGTLVWWSSLCNELNHRCRRWMSLIPGHCPGATLIFIQIFDSSVNVTPALQCAEAEG